MTGLIRWVVILVAGLLLVGLFTACSGDEKDSDTGEIADVINGDDEIDNRERVPVSADLAAFNMPEDWNIDDVIPLVLSDSLHLSLTINKKSNPLRDLISYAGRVSGDAEGDFTISRDGDRFLGNISLYAINQHYMIVHKPADDTHSAYQLVKPDEAETE